MKTRRTLGLAVALMVGAVVSAGCTGTIGPALSSPITGSSHLLSVPGLPPDYGHQLAVVSLCSLKGGPVTLHVHLSVDTGIADMTVSSGAVEPSLFNVALGADELGVDTELISSVPLAPRECGVVQIDVWGGGNGNYAPAFSYTLSW